MSGKAIKIPLKQYISLLKQYLKPQWKAMLGLALLLCFGIGLQLVNPQIIRYFIDTAREGGDMGRLLYAALLFILFALLHQGVTVAATYVGEHIGWTATNRLREDLAAHCLRLDMSFHKTRTPGEMIERVDGDINSLTNFFSNFFILLVGNVLLMGGIVLLLFREDWRVGVTMSAFVLFAIWFIRWIRQFAVPHWTRFRQMNAMFFGFLSEHIGGTEDTRANGATGYVMHRFYSLLRRWLPYRVNAYMGWAAMWITTLLVFTIGTAAALGIIYYLWRNGGITIGTAYLIFHYTEMLTQPIEKIRTQLEDLQRADASIHRVRELMAIRPNIEDGPKDHLPDGPLSVQFEHVTFRYEDDQDHPTLNDVHFELKPGEVLGLIGRTGSGKTTIARLLMRFYDPREGNVRVGGEDVRNLKIRTLRRKVALVSQSIELFHGTVRDNLTLYDESVDDRRILEVLKELGLDRWLAGLPDGLDTVLEAGGGGLSAGEAQLINFARVFLTDPGLVILDEASSRLDPGTEQWIEKALDRLLENRTCIIIAHRLNTVMRADRILILESGEIVEFGDREALAKDEGSRFRRMLNVGLQEALT